MKKHRLTRTIAVATSVALLALASVAVAGEELRPADPIRCDGLQKIVLTRRTISTKGTAIDVSGACTVRIEKSRIVADDRALLVSGSGRVEVVDSRIEGKRAAIDCSGSGFVHLAGSTIVGSRHASGFGKIEDGGKNTFAKIAGKAAPSDAPVTITDGVDSVHIGADGNVSIDSASTGEKVEISTDDDD